MEKLNSLFSSTSPSLLTILAGLFLSGFLGSSLGDAQDLSALARQSSSTLLAATAPVAQPASDAGFAANTAPVAPAASLGDVKDDHSNASITASAPAVRDITGKPDNFWEDFLNRTSPLMVTLDVSETYDDNIFIQPHKVQDYITIISPGISLELGDKTTPDSNYLSAVGQLAFLEYARNSSENADNYSVDVAYQHQFTRLTLGLEQVAQKLTLTNIDIGTRVQSDIYRTVATANYVYNEDLSLNGSFTQNVTDYTDSTYIDTAERVIDFYGLYEVLPRLGIGFGPRFGAVDVEGGPNQTYEDGLVHLIYQVTGKTAITLVGGAEVRQYQGSSAQTLTPTYDLDITYKPSDSTTLTFDSHRRRVVSFGSLDQDYLNTEISGSLHQRILNETYANLSAGYDMNTYAGNGDEMTGSNREDNYYYARAGVEWKARDWLELTATYQYARDDSNEGEFSFNDNQVTVKASLFY